MHVRIKRRGAGDNTLRRLHQEQEPQMFGQLVAAAPDWMQWMADE